MSLHVTNTNKYEYVLFDNQKDTINPDNEGLYTIRVFKTIEEGLYFTNKKDMKLAGIFILKE